MNTDQAFIPYSHFLAPRYWLTWLGLGLLRLLFLLPYSWQVAFTGRLMLFLRPLFRQRLHIARRNLELCFPEKTAEEIEHLLKAHTRALGIAVAESAMTWWGSDRAILALGQIEGIEHLNKATETGKGMLMLTGHFTTMELASQLLGLHHPMAGMYRPMKNRLMDQVILRARRRHATLMLKRDQIRNMTRALRSGEAVWYGFDQNYGQRNVFVPFFGVPAATITSTARFAQLGQALVVPFFPRRNDDGSYTIEVKPHLENFPSGDEVADARRLNEILEQAILKAPEQYLWIHRRFKTRPESEASVY